MDTCHYAHSVTTYLSLKKIDFIQKGKNAPNVPQARGIERFWSLCKQEYYRRQKKPKNVRGYRQVWKWISYEVAKKSVAAIMDSALRNLRSIGRRGIEGANLI